LPQSKKRRPTPQDTWELEQVCTNERDKAILWFFESAAPREETLTLLNWDDLETTGDPEIPYSFFNQKLAVERQRKW